MHYLFSHYAFNHPENFLDHWAKPVFVLLSAPFAYFGFKGMILFNVLCVTLTGLFTFYIAKKLTLKYALLVFPFLLGAPLFFKLTFSGLTEYLFALLTVIGIYLAQRDKLALAMIVVSFLPMVRSEGLIVMGVFGFYGLIERRFKLLPLLLTGQILYTLFGAIYHQDLLWVMHDIPYANMDSPYGKGGVFDFVFRLMYVIEKPLMLLLVIGLLSMLFQLFRKKYKREDNVTYVLIGGTFAALFIAHTLFWWLGIFNSMGLPRVLIAVVPMIVIIALMAINQLANSIKQENLKKRIVLGIVLIVLGFPFVTGENSVQYNREMFEVADHDMIDEVVAPFVSGELPHYSKQPVYYSHPYISMALNIDYFDHDEHLEMQHVLERDLEPGTVVIWDNWFSVSDGHTQLETLVNDSNFEVKGTFNRKTSDGEIRFVVLERI